MVMQDVGVLRPGEHRDRGGQAAVHQRLQVLGRRGGDVAHAHAAVLADVVGRVVGARVHGDVVPAGDQSRADLLDVVLDAANRGRNTALPDEGDASPASCRAALHALSPASAYIASMRSRCRSR